MSPDRYRRIVCALLAAALALGLLHAPSMMIGSAVAAGIDCHGSTANESRSHVTHDYQAPDEGQRPEKAPDKLHVTSNCPLANLTGIAAPATDLALEVRGTTIKQAEPTVMVAAPADLVDPPPRAVS
jgi:hypothetical protein